MSETNGKICPACAEEVKAAAKICRFCRHEFESPAAGAAAAGANAPADAAPSANAAPVAPPVSVAPAMDQQLLPRKRRGSMALTIAIYALLTGLGMALGMLVYDRFAPHPEEAEHASEADGEDVAAQDHGDDGGAVEAAKRHFEKAIATYYSDANAQVQMMATDPAARISVNIAMEMFDQPGAGLLFSDMDRQERETLAVWAATARSAGPDAKDLVLGATMEGDATIRPVWTGQARHNDRVLPAVLLEADLPLVNAVAGRRQTACLRRLSVIDKEFGMERGISYLPCGGAGSRATARAMQSTGVIDIPSEYRQPSNSTDPDFDGLGSGDQSMVPGDDFSDITNPAPAASPPSGSVRNNRTTRPSGVIAMPNADPDTDRAGHAAEAVAAAARAAAQVPTAAIRNQPGFNCAGADTRAERLICVTPDLARLDTRLNGQYSKLLREFAGHGREIQADQREWLRDTRDRCPDAACMKRAYDQRLTAIEMAVEYYSDIDAGM